MIRICNKYIVLLGILMSLFIGSLALADPLKIDISLQNATCKAVVPDMVQCSGITANWTDPQTNNPASLTGIDANFVWDPLNYTFRIKEVVSANCKNTVRVQVADIKGNPLPNVTVSVAPKGSTNTDEDGIARFQGVSKGTADISVTADGYQPQTLTVPVVCDGLIPVAVRLMPN
jgi:hypothetical protein